jgi:hypothetical protein
MIPHDTDEPFRLESLPNVLWTKQRVANELGVAPATVNGMVRHGDIPGPWTRDAAGRPLWAPETLETALRRRG